MLSIWAHVCCVEVVKGQSDSPRKTSALLHSPCNRAYQAMYIYLHNTKTMRGSENAIVLLAIWPFRALRNPGRPRLPPWAGHPCRTCCISMHVMARSIRALPGSVSCGACRGASQILEERAAALQESATSGNWPSRDTPDSKHVSASTLLLLALPLLEVLDSTHGKPNTQRTDDRAKHDRPSNHQEDIRWLIGGLSRS